MLAPHQVTAHPPSYHQHTLPHIISTPSHLSPAHPHLYHQVSPVLFTFLVLKCRRWSGWRWGSCKRGLDLFHEPCTSIWLTRITFSNVSCDGECTCVSTGVRCVLCGGGGRVHELQHRIVLNPLSGNFLIKFWLPVCILQQCRQLTLAEMKPLHFPPPSTSIPQ